jgi:MFS superfamily sulfate permease-like transporter
MSLSYAAYLFPLNPLLIERNLAKIRPINGLYATIAAPLVYAILGKTRRLAVLPEAALSLVVGEAIRQNIGKEGGHPHIGKSSDMASLITFLAALITFFAGMFRLGFVDIIGSPVHPRST